MVMTLIAPDETNPDRLREALDGIVQVDSQSFSKISVAHGATLNLNESVPLLVARLVGMFRRIRDSDLDAIPGTGRQTLASEIHHASAEFQRIRASHARNQSPDDIASSLWNLYQKAHGNLAPILAHIGTDPGDLGEFKRRATTVVGQIATAKEQVDTMLKESKTALDQIKQAAADAGVSQHATIFGEAAERHRRTKYVWLAGSAILALATLALAWQMAGQVADRALSDAIEFVAARIILFGVLSYALVSSVRTYRAEAHNHIVNSHRHHALSTFKIFTAASSDDATRNAVLMQATQCIFSHRPSGFGQREDDTAPPSQVLELTRNVLPKTSE